METGGARPEGAGKSEDAPKEPATTEAQPAEPESKPEPPKQESKPEESSKPAPPAEPKKEAPKQPAQPAKDTTGPVLGSREERRVRGRP